MNDVPLLGKGSTQVLAALNKRQPQTVNELSDRLVKGHSVVRQILNDLWTLHCCDVNHEPGNKSAFWTLTGKGRVALHRALKQA